MKKNRNAFFNNDSNMNFQNYNPMMNGQYQNGPIPFPGGNQNTYNSPFSEFEERFAKLERQISRLEKRINQLESSSIKSTDDFESTTNNMYML